jgi:uncharacterized damage-inducible protein DinB
MTGNRVPPVLRGDERDILNSWLEWHRETLAVKCAGLSDEQLRERSAPPSSMSLLGLVRHMANVERVWFRRVLNAEDIPMLWDKATRWDADFDDAETASVEESFATWHEEMEHSRKISAEMSLDAVGRWQRVDEDVSHRRTLIHLIQEYARHNGHADMLRERIDGMAGE